MPYNDKPNNRRPYGGDNRRSSHQGGTWQGRNNDDRKYAGYRRSDLQCVPNPYVDFNRMGNIGLLYTRGYYDGINEQVLNKVPINVETNTGNGIKREKTNHQAIYYRSRNENIICQSKQFIEPKAIPNSIPIELTTAYPGLLTGIGILHGTGHEGEAKLGLMFDHTTGLPYLPGSSVKGLLRSMFPLGDIEIAKKIEKMVERVADNRKKEKLQDKAAELRKRSEEKRSFIVKILGKENFTKEMVDDLEESIFDGIEIVSDEKTGAPTEITVTRRDIFFDAFPIKAEKHGLLGLDYITPHKDEFSNPKPIQFMRIEPDVTFRFEFLLQDSKKYGEIICDKEDKIKLFREILTTVGIGAKTNVGYGQLK